MNKLGSAKKHSGINPMGSNGQRDMPDHAGGHMFEMSCKSCSVPSAGNVKAAQIDGPFGGKVKA